MKRVAVLLHLGSTRYLREFRASIAKLEGLIDVYVNLVAEEDAASDLGDQLLAVNTNFDEPLIIQAENRGGAIGGLFKLLNEIQDSSYDAVLYLNDTLSDGARPVVLNALTTNSQEYIDLIAENSDTPMGMIGWSLYPYDYRVLPSYLSLLEKLGLQVSTSWEAMHKMHPETTDLDILSRTRWAVTKKIKAGRPEIDLEYAAAVLGDLNNPDKLKQITPELERQFIAHGVYGALPFFKDQCFWISPRLVELLSIKVSFEMEYEHFPVTSTANLKDDSLALAWTRVLPVFSIKNDFLIASIN